jgi:ElaB/YqjD/DUF883 family membrane-anchored ribosome-binding protein
MGELKSEIGQILDRYEIPMEDKSYILEKIEGEVAGVAQAINSKIVEEREKIKANVNGMMDQAKNAVHGTLSKAKNAVQEAYRLGMKEGLGQVKETGPNWMQIAITGAVILVAGIFVVREFLPRRD